MLILFKPWRSAKDLREPGQPWSDAFEDFMRNFPQKHKIIMTNMQLMHECKDSKDDHFKNRVQNEQFQIPSEYVHSAEDSIDSHGIEEDLLTHLDSISDAHATRIASSTANINSCLQFVEQAGMYNPCPSSVQDELITRAEDGAVDKVQANDTHIENEWKKTYEQRREQLKKLCQIQPIPGQENAMDSVQQAPSIQNPASLTDGTSSIEPGVEHQDHTGRTQLNVEDIVVEFTLNEEQARAFRIVACHATDPQGKSLNLFINGPGGTGKSRSIQALLEFFKRRGEARRLRLCSFTGVAARNILGITLHAALLLNQRSKKGSQVKMKRDLMAMWAGVDYLFIDEISMVGAQLLVDISDALADAKGNTLPFGGITIIFAGDFCQLPPVSQARLYQNPNRYANGKGDSANTSTLR